MFSAGIPYNISLHNATPCNNKTATDSGSRASEEGAGESMCTMAVVVVQDGCGVACIVSSSVLPGLLLLVLLTLAIACLYRYNVMYKLYIIRSTMFNIERPKGV